MLPKFAKAAAVLAFTAGVPDHATAVAIYDDINNSLSDESSIQDVLDKHPGACVWTEVENMTDGELWNEITCLAESISTAYDQLGE